ncbi:MAG: hypothetical protein ACTHQM_24740 [Thermoanaerobaculia bacterium]
MRRLLWRSRIAEYVLAARQLAEQAAVLRATTSAATEEITTQEN